MKSYCKICSTEKSVNEFYKCRLSRCKECVKLKSSKYRKEHIKERIEYNRKYYKKCSKEKNIVYQNMLIRNKERYRKNPKKHNKLTQNWYKKNKKEYLNGRKKYYQENKHQFRFRDAKRRARELKAQISLNKQQILELKNIYKNCPSGYEVDHIIPLQGKNVSGLHVPWNLQYLTKKDNRSKGNKV